MLDFCRIYSWTDSQNAHWLTDWIELKLSIDSRCGGRKSQNKSETTTNMPKSRMYYFGAAKAATRIESTIEFMYGKPILLCGFETVKPILCGILYKWMQKKIALWPHCFFFFRKIKSKTFVQYPNEFRYVFILPMEKLNEKIDWAPFDKICCFLFGCFFFYHQLK